MEQVPGLAFIEVAQRQDTVKDMQDRNIARRHAETTSGGRGQTGAAEMGQVL